MAGRQLGDRFWSKVRQSGDCWEWTGCVDKDGYGGYWVDEHLRKGRAHRLSYEFMVGEVPEGMVLDHLCRNRACVNPDHLEPVTNATNTFRGETITARNVDKTHCANGHPFSPENTAVSQQANGRPRRSCRTCRRGIKARYLARMREAADCG